MPPPQHGPRAVVDGERGPATQLALYAWHPPSPQSPSFSVRQKLVGAVVDGERGPATQLAIYAWHPLSSQNPSFFVKQKLVGAVWRSGWQNRKKQPMERCRFGQMPWQWVLGVWEILPVLTHLIKVARGSMGVHNWHWKKCCVQAMFLCSKLKWWCAAHIVQGKVGQKRYHIWHQQFVQGKVSQKRVSHMAQ
jgi:hypothetical protein